MLLWVIVGMDGRGGEEGNEEGAEEEGAIGRHRLVVKDVGLCMYGKLK